MVFNEGCSVVPRSREVKVMGKNGRVEGRSLLSGTAQGSPTTCKASLEVAVVGRCAEMREAGTQKVRGWQGPKIALVRISARRSVAPKCELIEKE